MVASGLMRDYVDIQADTGEQNREGEHIANYSTEFMPSVPGELKWVGGGERVRSQQMDAETMALFTCRWFEGVTATMRIKDLESETTWGIVRIDRIRDGGGNYELAIQLKTIE